MTAPLALTMGDPAGIGIEICLKSWELRKVEALCPFVLIGDFDTIQKMAKTLDSGVKLKRIETFAEGADIFATALPVFDPTKGATAAEYTIAAIETAVTLCQSGDASGMVTAPIQKKRLYDAGFTHPGHTEFLAALTNAPGQEVMMLAGPELRVVPATVHIPVKDVPSRLSTELILQIIRTTAKDLRERFGLPHPRLAVAGLNPHAGEGGSMGREEIDIIQPAIDQARDLGLDVRGPLSADTLFHKAARAQYDAAICMYHDQALIPIKTIDFDRGVNVTLGLPIIRTSPDHGTADDIAGKNIANPASLIAALKMATDMVRASESKSDE